MTLNYLWTSCDTLFSCIRPQLTIRNQSIVCNSILTCILCSDIHTHVGRGSEYIAFCVTNNHCVKNVILGRSGVFFHCLPNEYPSCSHTATARRGGNGGAATVCHVYHVWWRGGESSLHSCGTRKEKPDARLSFHKRELSNSEGSLPAMSSFCSDDAATATTTTKGNSTRMIFDF